jgi:hypothetical protein
MLATNPVVRKPDPVEASVRPQIINVPVRPLRHLLMMREAGSHASQPERAANINVETSSQFEGAEFPDLDALFPATKKD